MRKRGQGSPRLASNRSPRLRAFRELADILRPYETLTTDRTEEVPLFFERFGRGCEQVAIRLYGTAAGGRDALIDDFITDRNLAQKVDDLHGLRVSGKRRSFDRF